LLVSLIVTAVSIIFFFAGRQIFHKLELDKPITSGTTSSGKENKSARGKYAEDGLGATSRRIPWWERWSGIGGTVVSRIELNVESKHDVQALETFQNQTAKFLDTFRGRPMAMLSTESLKRDLLSQAWIEQASVRKIFPDKLQIKIVGREPAFVLRGMDAWVLADSRGSLISASKFLSGRWATLPRVFGIEDRLQGDLDDMDRQLTQERVWLQDLSALLSKLHRQVLLQPQEVKIIPDSWTGSAMFVLKSAPYEIRLTSGQWNNRLNYLQYILSDLHSETTESTFARIEGQYPDKWYVTKGKQ